MSTRRPGYLVLAIFFITILACNALVPAATPSVKENQNSTSENAVAAVALQLDGERRELSSFLGPNTALWDLKPGHYLITFGAS